MNHKASLGETEHVVERSREASCLSVADAARRLGVSRSTVYRDIRRGKIEAVEQPDGARVIELTELRRAYGDHECASLLSASPAPDDNDDRIAQLENAVLTLVARLESLEAEIEAGNRREARQRCEIDSLLARQPPLTADEEPAPLTTPTSRYYSRKRRSAGRKLIDRLKKLTGIFALVAATMGIVLGVVYVIQQWDSGPGYSQSSQ